MSINPEELQHPHVAEKIGELKEHVDAKPVWLADKIDDFIRGVGHVFCWVNAILVAIIILQVILRYGFSSGLVVLEELQWHLYAIGVMMGLSYAQVNDSHIRVDVLHARFSDRTKRLIEIFGICVLILPFIYVVFMHGLDFVYESWRVNERSDAPLGLPYRWAIKAFIPISFGLLALAVFSRLYRDVYLLVRGK